jgi:hypothetical protein
MVVVMDVSLRYESLRGRYGARRKRLVKAPDNETATARFEEAGAFLSSARA